MVLLGWFLNTFRIFHLENSASGFPQLFQLCFHIAQGHIPPQIACVFGVACLLAMNKHLGEVRPITMGEALYWFISRVLCFQFHETCVLHFSPHKFGVTTKGGYEIVIHYIRCTLELHLNWVVPQLDMANAFKSVLRGVIFQEFLVACGDII
jgi:hypothetical protein